MIRKMCATLLLASLASAAFANSCPILIKDIDAALDDPAVTEHLSEGQLTKVRQLRDKGAEAHQSGDHAQSMDALNRAREILGIS